MLFFVSCGGKSDKSAETKKDICDVKNKIAISIQDYHDMMNDTLVYSCSAFDVKSTEYSWKSDSTATLKMSNYLKDNNSGDDKSLDINISLYACNGKKLVPGFYAYSGLENGLWCSVTLGTVFGTVYFNGSNQGGITINKIDATSICGNINLNTNSPKDPMIGVVKANGDFSYKQ